MATTNLPIARIAEGFARLPAQNRVALMMIVAALLAVLAAAWLWSRNPDYRILYANVQERDGGAIVSALGRMNVPYRFNEGGNAILVPAESVHEARLKLASQGLPKGGNLGFELMENQKLGATQFQEQVAYQRALEGELARSVQSLAAVQSARVHLAVPKPSAFLREQSKASASVLVNLYPGKTLERGQVAGIVHLVAASVPELSPRSVSVIDQSGALLSAASDGSAMNLDPGQLAHMQQIEANYIRRIIDMLEPLVGRSNVRAQVTAEIDFSATESTAESYRPNKEAAEAAVRSQQTSESNQPSGGSAPGVPGAISNQASHAAGAASGSATRKDQTVQYELDRTVRHTRQPVGTVKRLSVAVVVNHRKGTAKDGKASTTPLSDGEMKQITALAREAIGFSEARGDTLNLVNAAFNVEVMEAAPETPLWQQPDTLAYAKEIGKHLLALGLALYIVLGVLRPLLRHLSTLPPAPEPVAESIALEHDSVRHADQLSAVRQLARQDPKMVANLVKGWVSGNE
ncbi:MAG: flagellar M-ring protein FliF [Betaproteobacteria bacterium]|nr:flagellar M-ring protein FliF [Betaproteobacteria bacterium]